MRLLRATRHIPSYPPTTRYFSCTSASFQSATDPSITASSPSSTTQLSARWLSDLKAQAGKSRRREEGQRVLDYLSEHWLELLAGAEGFLSAPRWGLPDHRILWGDMVGNLPEIQQE
jgi:hypothetical protein